MALGEFAKQITQQAILNATTPKEPAPAPLPEGLAHVIFGQVHAMQKVLKEDEELAVYFESGPDRIRVMEIFAASPKVAVLSGVDQERNRARVIAPMDALQLVCKVVKAVAGAKPLRVNLVLPKPKDSNG